MKNVWIEKACPIEAAKFTAPVPNKGIVFSPEGSVAATHIKKMQYITILMIPYPKSLAPKCTYLRRHVKSNKNTALQIGLITVLTGISPYHCYTIRLKYRNNNRIRLLKTIKS